MTIDENVINEYALRAVLNFEDPYEDTDENVTLYGRQMVPMWYVRGVLDLAKILKEVLTDEN